MKEINWNKCIHHSNSNFGPWDDSILKRMKIVNSEIIIPISEDVFMTITIYLPKKVSTHEKISIPPKLNRDYSITFSFVVEPNEAVCYEPFLNIEELNKHKEELNLDAEDEIIIEHLDDLKWFHIIYDNCCEKMGIEGFVTLKEILKEKINIIDGCKCRACGDFMFMNSPDAIGDGMKTCWRCENHLFMWKKGLNENQISLWKNIYNK